ncbi:MAG: alpha/beta hydrolase [Acetivibrionales bacterium]
MRISGITYAVRKTHRIRNTIFAFIVLLLLGILAVAVLSGYKGWKLLHPDKKPVDKFSSNIVPEYRDISFRKSDSSIVLKGWLFQAKKSDRAVILAHSHGGNRLQFGLETVDLIKEFLSRGYNVFTFDMRNSGESGGKTSTFGYGEKEDIEAAINYLNSQGIKRITLMGFSTGASASILAAAESASVDAVIADSPYADLKSYFLNNLDRWTGLPAFPFNRTITAGLEFAGVIDMAKTSPGKFDYGGQASSFAAHPRKR